MQAGLTINVDDHNIIEHDMVSLTNINTISYVFLLWGEKKRDTAETSWFSLSVAPETLGIDSMDDK